MRKCDKLQMYNNESNAQKVVMLGTSGVGKTSVVLQLHEKVFKRIVMPTVGSGVISKEIKTSKGIVSLRIWDTAGEERYRTFTGLYSQGAVGCIVMFDITDKNSFDSVKEWIDLFKKNCNENAHVFLAGNKIDLNEERQISFEKASKFALDNKIKYYEVSAKTGEHVDLLFSDLAEAVGPGLPQLDPISKNNNDSNCFC